MILKNILKKLDLAYRQLIQANEKFVAGEPAADSFRVLVEQRNLIIEDLDVLTEEMLREINHSYRDNSFACRNLVEAVRAISILAPDLDAECRVLKDSLAKIVETDMAVEKKITDLKDSVKSEIIKIRKGSKVLKGYKQADPMGSCFINKVK
ncbi:MAG: hypothetical protein AB1403_14980 [Candidatus Riflebacteria bacterium]